MTVYARGYRTYEGTLRALPASIVIARESIARIWRTKAFRRIGVMFLLWFAVWAFVLYLALGTEAGILREVLRRAINVENVTLGLLDLLVLKTFYSGIAVLTALLTIFVGSGLIADDLKAGALPLYLVRPIRAVDYVAGKALVIPVLLLVASLLPGLFFYLLAGFWQEPGQSWAFLAENLDVLGRVLQGYVIAASSYTGLALLLSSRTPRRGAAAALAAVVIIGGVMLRALASEGVVRGVIRDVFLHVDLPHNATAPFLAQAQSYQAAWEWEPVADETWALFVSLGLLLLGLLAAWRRARTVEVTA